jgi:PAS domain S-box-containing protein
MTTDPVNMADEGDPTGAAAQRLHLQQLFEFAPDGQLLTDGQGVIVEANHAAAAVLRSSKEFLIGKPLGLLVAQAGRRRFYEGLAKLHGAARSDEFETRMGRRGEMWDVAFRVAVVEDRVDGEAAFRWLVRDITEQRRAEAAREELMRRLVTAQEDERRRVARELHDSVGQLLTALSLGVRAVRDAGPLPPAALERLDEVQRVADELGRTTHDLAVRLRPTALDDVGLVAAVQHEVADWSARTGVEVRFQAVGLGSQRFPPEVETVLYRVVQEALTNVLRHANARLVSVVIERANGLAIAIIEDNGIGFDPDAAAGGGRLGLLGMRERVALLGGMLEVESSPGAGTTVIARLPSHAGDRA